MEHYILDKHRQFPDKEFIVEFAWISPHSNYPEREERNEDHEDNINPEKIGIQYRYHLHMKSLRANLVGQMTDKPFIPVSDLMEGNNWEHNENTGTWLIPSMDLLEEIVEPDMDSAQTFKEDELTNKQCEQPKETFHISNDIDHKVQSDTGANANITSNLSILEDIQWVEPVLCKSAKKDASIEVRAIGKNIRFEVPC